MRRGTQLAEDLPPPGSRGGPDEIAVQMQSTEEQIKTQKAKQIHGKYLE